MAALFVFGGLASQPAGAQFPGSDPSESPRINTPDDPGFDPCEADDETTPGHRECTSYFSEQWGLFGFRPDSAVDLLGRPLQYADCSQLDAAGRAANAAAGDPECSQIAGVRADVAWKYSTGSPSVSIAILDTGIRWQDRELVDKIRLSRRELPAPRRDGSPLREGIDCGAYRAGDDADGDGAFSVADFACDPRVQVGGGDTESDELLDASDLIAAFSDGRDADRNGYVDDIAGWDFFDDDNDPFDASSCCSAEGHGTGRAREAARATDDGQGEAGLCPRCQILPLRVWDSFVVDTNFFALALVYAADNGASVAEGAVAGLVNSSFARRAFAYADRKGMALMIVSSDVNSANHNYPTHYNEAVYVAGTLPDSAPGERCEIPGLPTIGNPTGVGELPGCKAFLEGLEQHGVPPVSGQPPTTSFFRNANITQYGGKADIVLVGATGSQNTGQAAGAAGLLQSFARQRLRRQHRFPRRLTGNQIRQLLTMTAEDVLPANTGTIGLPDRAEKGWDSHFGYGRVNLAAAMARIRSGRIPPDVRIDGPDWFTPINVDRLGPRGVPVRGRVTSPHFRGRVRWQLAYACGQEPGPFRRLVAGTGEVDGILGYLTRARLRRLADTCDGSVANDAGRPAGRPSDAWPADPYPDPDPERHAFQIRLTAHEVARPENVGTYRKTLFAYRDDGNLTGWPRPLGSDARPARFRAGTGGESSPRLADLDGDDRLELLLPTSSGELHVMRPGGRPLRSFNRGRPVRTRPYAVARAHRDAGGLGEGILRALPREPLRVPAVGDVTGDGEPEILVTAGEHLYAWTRRGRRLRGFPVRVDPSLSQPCVAGVAEPCFDAGDRAITSRRHIKRGFLGSPALADLDGDGRLEIVAGALDQHLYAWSGAGDLVAGFPVRLDAGEPDDGAEIINTPAIGELDGTPGDEIVISTNEVLDARRSLPDGRFRPDDLLSLFASAARGSSPVYAVDGDGRTLPGWPIEIGVISPDIVPFVVPGHDSAMIDVDGDGRDEVSVAASTGQARLVDADGITLRTYQSTPGPDAQVTDRTLQLNFADYASIGRLSAEGAAAVVKGGLSLGLAENLLAPNQNLPFNHAVQAWAITADPRDPRNGSYLPGFPVATDDFQVLSQPVIAKVDGAGAGRQALVGTGLYQLHAYGEGGTEPRGWPKFLGGWVQSTPAVGDLDDDGRLDVVAQTREGWGFAWGTEAPACAAGAVTTNEEWWTFHHDEHGTSNYGHDARPPSRPGPLTVRRHPSGDLEVSFTRAGDDLRCGLARTYEIAGARRPITGGRRFTAAQRLAVQRDEVVPAAGAGEDRLAVRVPGGARFRHVAVRAVDDAGNVSYVRSERRR